MSFWRLRLRPPSTKRHDVDLIATQVEHHQFTMRGCHLGRTRRFNSHSALPRGMSGGTALPPKLRCHSGSPAAGAHRLLAAHPCYSTESGYPVRTSELGARVECRLDAWRRRSRGRSDRDEGPMRYLRVSSPAERSFDAWSTASCTSGVLVAWTCAFADAAWSRVYQAENAAVTIARIERNERNPDHFSCTSGEAHSPANAAGSYSDHFRGPGGPLAEVRREHPSISTRPAVSCSSQSIAPGAGSNRPGGVAST